MRSISDVTFFAVYFEFFVMTYCVLFSSRENSRYKCSSEAKYNHGFLFFEK